MLTFWTQAQHAVKEYGKVILLYVTNSKGSSPGRQGFRMLIDAHGGMFGSIGGGIMEHKMVEWAKTLISQEAFLPFIKKQIHKDAISENRSGMICDGQQTIAFIWLDSHSLNTIDRIIRILSENKKGTFKISPQGINCYEEPHLDGQYNWEYYHDQKWELKEEIGFKETIYIIGGGHVGLALSEVMNRLGFYVVNIDDRKLLNTMGQNSFAHKKIIAEYGEIEKHIPEGNHQYVALMSFGYRADETCLKRLIGRNYKYLGVMGSQTKMEQLFRNLLDHGFKQTDIDKIYSPIGLKIKSKKPMEIAISVAAEIIAIKNGAF